MVQKKPNRTIIISLLSVFAVFTLSTSFNYTDKEITRLLYPNGKLQYHTVYYDSCQCEVSKAYYKSGALRSVMAHKKNYRPIGERISYYKNGVVKSYVRYDSFKKNGKTYRNYENGRFWMKGQYDKGVPIGNWLFYNRKGQVEEQKVYAENNTDRYWEFSGDLFWYYNNEPFLKQEYELGKKVKTKVLNVNIHDTSHIYKYLEGKNIFRRNCSSCHSLYHDDATGPNLKGIFDRRERKWVKKFIINSAALIASGDEQAIQVYNAWNKTAMTCFPYFTDKEWKALFYYLEK